jgi:hypothetical protein
MNSVKEKIRPVFKEQWPYSGWHWKTWVAIVALFLVVMAVAGVGALLVHLFPDDNHPATITLIDGTTVHCDDGYWYGGGFGASNKFKCDDTTYAIQSIEKVTT